MDIETKPKPLRIVSGPYREMEHQLNQLLKDYVALVWNLCAIADQMHVTCVMIHQSEMRKMQLMQGGPIRPN